MDIYHIVKVTVLIDTWWNVNINDAPFLIALFVVLIDTWWNVNINTTGIIIKDIMF